MAVPCCNQLNFENGIIIIYFTRGLGPGGIIIIYFTRGLGPGGLE